MDFLRPSPPTGPESARFYDAASQGRFLIRRCEDCGEAHWYPRAHCPFCFGATRWEEASGKGEIYSYSVMRRAEPPFAIAYVTLDEGPRMMTNIVDCDFDALHIGMRVRLEFVATENGTPIPCFAPATETPGEREPGPG